MLEYSSQLETVAVLQCYFFFFQAEDGIRDTSVTGVQTCALPICSAAAPASELLLGAGRPVARTASPRRLGLDDLPAAIHRRRSEERRVGKECRSRWWRDH